MVDPVAGRTVLGGLTVITLAGDLDVAVAPGIADALAVRPEAARPDLVVDLRQVTFMECSAVGAIMAAYRTTRDAGGCLRVVLPRAGYRRVLELTHPSVLCFFDDLQQATTPVCGVHHRVLARMRCAAAFN